MSNRQNLLLINQPWLREEFTELGYTVTTAGVGDNRGLDITISDIGTDIEVIFQLLPELPDGIILFDDSSTLKIFGLERLEIPCIFYSVDGHHHWRWHRYFSALFDLTLIAQRQYMPEFKSESQSVRWFPLWPLRLPAPLSVKENIASFRGNLSPALHPEREIFFSKLNQIVPVDAKEGDWADPYAAASIVINQTVGGDLNFRNFEALAAKALLVTPHLDNGFPDLFIEGTDYIGYHEGDAAEAGGKIKYYLEHPEEAAKIAASGHEKLLRAHTSKARAKELDSFLSTLKNSEKPRKYCNALLSLVPSLISMKYYEKNEAADRYLTECLRLLKNGIQEGESFQEDYPSAGVFVILLVLVDCSKFLELEEVGKALLKARAIDPIINAVFVIQALLSQGNDGAALEVAKEFSDNPSELIWSIPNLLAQVRDSVMSSLGATR